MVFRAAHEHKKEIEEVYKTVFGEPLKVCRLFFDGMADWDNVFAIKNNNKIASVAFGVPTEFQVNGRLCKSVYICGVATLKEYRGMGYSRDIMEYMKGFYKSQGIDFLYLVPATAELFGMYEKYGFKTAFYLNRRELPYEHKKGSKKLFNIGARELNKLYEKMCISFKVFAKRNEKKWDFIMKEFEMAGGGVIGDKDGGYAIYHISGKTLHLREITMDIARVSETFKNEQIEKIVITKPCCGDEFDIPYAMVYAFEPNLQNDLIKHTDCNFTNLNFD